MDLTAFKMEGYAEQYFRVQKKKYSLMGGNITVDELISYQKETISGSLLKKVLATVYSALKSF